MKGKEELSLNALEFVIGGIQHKELLSSNEIGGANPPAMSLVYNVQCPKCLKTFTMSSYDNAEFERIHVDNCTG